MGWTAPYWIAASKGQGGTLDLCLFKTSSAWRSATSMVLQRAMLAWLIRILLALRSVSEARASREAEILVLRQQLVVLSRRSRKQVRLLNLDRLVLVWLYRLFPSLLNSIIIVKPETLLRWHRRGFRAGAGSLGGAAGGLRSIANSGH